LSQMRGGRPRTRRVWTRLGEEEYAFLNKLRGSIGASTEGEALRWLVQFTKLMLEKWKLGLLPPEFYKKVMPGGKEGREDQD